MKFRIVCFALCFALASFSIAVGSLFADAIPALTNEPIQEFALNDFAGAERALSEWKDRPVLVIVFLGTECPLAKLYGRKLVELDQKYAKRGVQIVGVNSNQQ